MDSTALPRTGAAARKPGARVVGAGRFVREAPSSARRWLEPVWAHRWPSALAAFGLVAGWGALVGWWTPRGPLTAREALWSIGVSVAVGALAGLLTRSRWAMLGAPLVFVAAVELARLDAVGPTVDGIHVSTYGLLALAVGRGFHALVSWAPMILGAAVGAGAARALGAVGGGRRRWTVVTRRAITGLATVGLVVLSVALARPARTDPIVDAAGNPVPGSVAELTTLDVNGHDLTMLIRGVSADNPVLLFLAGGPGGSELGAMRRHLPALERDFTVATWDQRGTGTSYAALDPVTTVSLQGFIDDTIDVTNYLRHRFGQERIYLVGQSWGSLLGVLAADRHPELYTAFIGVGQMVSPLATDRIFYDDTLAWARARGDHDLVDDLVEIGPPPYARMLDYETALSHEHEVYPYDHRANSEGEGGFSENFLVEEYTPIEQVHLLAAFMDTFGALYPQLQHLDLRRSVPALDVPVFFVQGAHEAPARSTLFTAWFQRLEAPSKDIATLATSGHRPMFEQPEEFVAYMVDTVLAQTA